MLSSYLFADRTFKDRKAGALSGGMKQKLALCCALVHKPSVLFLDEPTTGVDPVSRKELWDILSLLKEREITIVASTPYLDEVRRCERVAFLSEGKIRGIGSPEKILHEFSDIFSPPNLEHDDKHDNNKVGSTTENVIEVEHLVKAFGTFHAVDDISFTVRKGEIFGFLGPTELVRLQRCTCSQDSASPQVGREGLWDTTSEQTMSR